MVAGEGRPSQVRNSYWFSRLVAITISAMKSYGQFCPVAKAAEILGERWSILIVREIMVGSHRFNELRRGNPLISPSTLSQRLQALEKAGVVEKREGAQGIEYHLSPAGRDLEPIIMQLGQWGRRWAKGRLVGGDFDPALLMWDMRRRLDVSAFPAERTVLFLEFIDAPSKVRFWWLVVEHGEVDLCLKDPGHEVDLHLRTRIRTMAEIWMGDREFKACRKRGEIEVRGARSLQRGISDWLGYSVFKDKTEPSHGPRLATAQASG